MASLNDIIGGDAELLVETALELQDAVGRGDLHDAGDAYLTCKQLIKDVGSVIRALEEVEAG